MLIASSFLIAIIVPLISKAVGSPEALLNKGLILVLGTKPKSKSLLLIFELQFKFFILLQFCMKSNILISFFHIRINNFNNYFSITFYAKMLCFATCFIKFSILIPKLRRMGLEQKPLFKNPHRKELSGH